VLRNWVVNLGWTRRSSGRGCAGACSVLSDLKNDLSFFTEEVPIAIS
jgi:hypothetical protein